MDLQSPEVRHPTDAPTHPNRAFLLTAPGTTAIAVVRLVGPLVGPFLRARFARPARLGRAVHADLRDGDRVVDDPVVALVRDDCADVSLHGGPWVVRSALDLMARAGFDVGPAPDDPLPPDAVDADADDPVGREVLQFLPLARTELGVRALLAQPAAWADMMRSGPTPAEAAAALADRAMDRLLRPAGVAIVGAANVGKSTLANQLFGRERSITADLPGTTRDWVGELADLDGVPILLVDTPGLRATDDPIEQAAVVRARPLVAAADVVVVVVDAARPLDAEQRGPLVSYPGAVVVANKTDRPAAWDAGARLGGREVVRVVATAGRGVDELRRAILRRIGCEAFEAVRPMCWTERQRRVLLAHR